MNELTSSTQDTYQLHPIGQVQIVGTEYRLVIEPKYRPALKQLDQFSYAIVFWWADQHDNPDDRNYLVTELPYAPGVQAGVFACRAEYRPNPIAITNCFILDIDEQNGVIQVPWIDAFDGTPLLDLKPYIPLCDRIRDVKVPEWFADWPECLEDAESYFAEHDVELD